MCGALVSPPALSRPLVHLSSHRSRPAGVPTSYIEVRVFALPAAHAISCRQTLHARRQMRPQTNEWKSPSLPLSCTLSRSRAAPTPLAAPRSGLAFLGVETFCTEFTRNTHSGVFHFRDFRSCSRRRPWALSVWESSSPAVPGKSSSIVQLVQVNVHLSMARRGPKGDLTQTRSAPRPRLPTRLFRSLLVPGPPETPLGLPPPATASSGVETRCSTDFRWNSISAPLRPRRSDTRLGRHSLSGLLRRSYSAALHE